jgi:signal transduction histidine kinase
MLARLNSIKRKVLSWSLPPGITSSHPNAPDYELLATIGISFGILGSVLTLIRLGAMGFNGYFTVCSVLISSLMLAVPICMRQGISLTAIAIFPVLAVASWAFLTGLSATGLASPGVSVLIVLPFIGVFLGSRRTGIISLVIAIVSFGLIAIATHYQLVGTPQIESHPPVYRATVYSFITFCAWSLANSFERARVNQVRQTAKDTQSALSTVLATGMAHEINNPLTIIMGNLWSLEKNLDKVDKVSEYREISIIREMSDRIASLVRDLMRLDSNEPLRENRVNVRSLIQSVHDDYFAFAQKERVTIEIHAENSPNPTVYCSEKLAKKSLSAIVENSIEAAAINKKNRLVAIRIETTEDTRFIDIVVNDTGPGIPTTLREKIWTPFFTTKKPTSDAHRGLSLALARNAVRLMGGDLILDDQVSPTTFRLRLEVV